MGKVKSGIGAGMAAMLLTFTLVATTGSPAAAAPTLPSYLHTGAVLLEYATPPDSGALPIGVPTPVLQVQARVSQLPTQPVGFSSGGIPSQTLTFAVRGVPVCTVVTNADGRGSCALSLLNQVDAVLGAPVTVSYAGNTTYLPSSRTVPLIGHALRPDPFCCF